MNSPSLNASRYVWVFALMTTGLLSGCSMALKLAFPSLREGIYVTMKDMSTGQDIGRIDFDRVNDDGMKVSGGLRGLMPNQMYVFRIEEIYLTCSGVEPLVFESWEVKDPVYYRPADSLTRKLVSNRAGEADVKLVLAPFSKFDSIVIDPGKIVTLRICRNDGPVIRCEAPPVACGYIGYDAPDRQGWRT